MTTTTTNFKSIQLLRQWCMLTLPTVFNDALSYNEQVCKLTEAINEMATTINGLPDYIIELVKELLDQMNLEEIVKQVLADYFFINVKNPPAPLVGARGDGIANDTVAIQAMIDYVAGKKTYLFFPGGIYSVNQLVMKTGVSLIGEDRYRTIINLEAASNVDLIGGDMGDCTIGNLTLSANMPGQTQNCSIYNGNVGDMLWYNVILKNAYDVISMDMGSLVQMTNIIVDGTQGNGLTIGGERCTISNLDFVNTSELNNNTLLTLNSNYAVVDKITCFTAIKNGINITGDYCWVDGIIQNAVTPVTNTGVGNVINVAVANNNIVIKPKTSESYSGGLTVSAPSSTELIAGDKTVNASGVSVTANGAMELDGHANVVITAGNNITETATNSVILKGTDVNLNPSNPLTYGTVKTDGNIKYVDMKDKNGNPYKLLSDITIPEPEKDKDIPITLYPITMGLTEPFECTSQGFTMDDTFYYQAFTTPAKDNVYLRKISINDNSFTDYNLNISGNGNSLAVDETYLYVLDSSTKANCKLYTLNKSTLTVVSELTPTPWLCGISVDKTSNILYALSHDPIGVYKIENNNITLVQSFTTKYQPPNQGLGVYDGVAYIPLSFPRSCYKLNLTTGVLESIYLPTHIFISYLIEPEDICFDQSGNMYVSGAMYSTGNGGYYTISTTKHVDFALTEKVIVNVKESKNILPVGNTSFPFPDIQTALWFVKLNDNNPAIRTIDVKTGTYGGFQAYGVNCQIIGTTNVNITSQIICRSSVIDMENLNMTGLTGKYNIVLEDTLCYLNNVIISGLTFAAILADKGSIVHESNSSYSGTHIACRNSHVYTKNYDKIVKALTGPSYVTPGVYMAGKTGTSISWDLQTTIGTNTWTIQPAVYYAINIAGNYYFVNRSGTVKFNVSGVEVTAVGTETTLTLTAASSITVNYIYSM